MTGRLHDWEGMGAHMLVLGTPLIRLEGKYSVGVPAYQFGEQHVKSNWRYLVVGDCESGTLISSFMGFKYMVESLPMKGVLVGIRGNTSGYRGKILAERHRFRDIDVNEPKSPARRSVIVRMDLPAELVDHIEELAEENDLSRNSMIVKLLQEASSERR